MSEMLSVFFLWFHSLAILIWLGGIVFILLVALPASRQLGAADAGKLMGAVTRRFTPLVNGSILVLFFSGAALLVVQGGHAGGEFGGSGGVGMAVKLLLFALMVAVHFYRGVVLAAHVARTEAGEEKARLQRRSLNLVKLNLALGMVVLLLSLLLGVA